MLETVLAMPSLQFQALPLVAYVASAAREAVADAERSFLGCRPSQVWLISNPA
jgi:hypothetical protein